jgi:DNA-binding MarR family transcriptional regulator
VSALKLNAPGARCYACDSDRFFKPCGQSVSSEMNIASTFDGSPLTRWMNTLVDYVRSGEPDLTNRQMALLLVVYLSPGPHTVRGLARALNVSKPVVTRALNRLGALGYLRRQRDDTDKRNIFIARTTEGAGFLEEFGQFVGESDPPRARRATA